MFIRSKLSSVYLYTHLLSYMIFILLTGCQRVDELAGIKKEIAELKQTSRHQAMVTAQNELQLPKPVVYQHLVSLVDDQSKSADKQTQLLQPLQAYSLSSYQFIGTLTRHKQTFGYLKAPNDIVYQVKRGDLLGTEYGQITDITSGQLSVLVDDKTKKPPKRQVITMQLREQQ